MNLFNLFIESRPEQERSFYEEIITFLQNEKIITQFEDISSITPTEIAGNFTSFNNTIDYYATRIYNESKTLIESNELRSSIENAFYAAFRSSVQEGLKVFINDITENNFEKLKDQNKEGIISQINALHPGHLLIHSILSTFIADATAFLQGATNDNILNGQLLTDEDLSFANKTFTIKVSANSTFDNSKEDTINTNNNGFFNYNYTFTKQAPETVRELYLEVVNGINENKHTYYTLTPSEVKKEDMFEIRVAFKNELRVFRSIASSDEKSSIIADLRKQLELFFQQRTVGDKQIIVTDNEESLTIQSNYELVDELLVVTTRTYPSEVLVYFQLSIEHESTTQNTITALPIMGDKTLYHIVLNELSITQEEDKTPTLTLLKEQAGFELPATLQNILENENKVHTFQAIQTAGGASKLAREAGLAEEEIEAAGKLDAHILLYASSNTTALDTNDQLKGNQKLIEQNIFSLKDFAETSRVDAANTIASDTGDYNAVQSYESASAQSAFLKSVALGYAVGNNTYKSEKITLDPILKSVFTKKCGCKDCESGVSPLAYLADLLNYAFTHLQDNGNKVDFEYLENTFKQRFKDLPATCKELNKQVCQPRICIEVLLDFLPDRGVGAKIDPIRKKYAEEAYPILLQKIGTSLDEVKRIQTASVAEKQKLADRLGIYYSNSESPDIFYRMLFENPHEVALEDFFGLKDTGRNPFNDGLVLDDGGKIPTYNLHHIQWEEKHG